MGRREPYLHLTAQQEETPGIWVDVPPKQFSRCGNYDEAWDKDLVKLPPGGTLKLEWLVPPAYTLNLPKAGRVRIYAHYKYGAGKEPGGFFGSRVRVPPELEGVPAYEIVSPPVEIQIVQPTAERGALR